MYIVWSDVVQRYDIAKDYVNNSSDETASIQYAEGELHNLLSGAFTLPFSSNNITAKDLSIDIAYARTQMYKDEDKYNTVMDRIKSITEKLSSGELGMMLDDGSVIYSDINKSASKAYSTTQDYHPTFDMGDTLDMVVSSAMIDADYDAKGFL